MHNQTDPSAPDLIPATARTLNHHRYEPYKMLTGPHGIEWLVDFVVDHGRFIALIMVGTSGRIIRSITPRDYHLYTITLGPEDL